MVLLQVLLALPHVSPKTTPSDMDKKKNAMNWRVFGHVLLQ